jgi:hypothetical protein
MPAGSPVDKLENNASPIILATIAAAVGCRTVQITRDVNNKLDTIRSFPVGAAAAAAKIVDHAILAGTWSELKHHAVTIASMTNAVSSACERRPIQIAGLVGNEFSARLSSVGTPAFRTKRMECVFRVSVGVAHSEATEQGSCANQDAQSRAAAGFHSHFALQSRSHDIAVLARLSVSHLPRYCDQLDGEMVLNSMA